VDHVADVGSGGRLHHPPRPVDVDPAQALRVPSGLQRPRQVHHRVGAVEERREQRLAGGPAQVGQVPAHPVVRRGVRRLPAGEPAHLGDPGLRIGQPAQQGGAHVAGGAGDGDGQACEVRVGHAVGVPR
jgi:hypothetical protein